MSYDKIGPSLDHIRRYLEASYRGAFKLVQRLPKHFPVEINNTIHSKCAKNENVC